MDRFVVYCRLFVSGRTPPLSDCLFISYSRKNVGFFATKIIVPANIEFHCITFAPCDKINSLPPSVFPRICIQNQFDGFRIIYWIYIYRHPPFSFINYRCCLNLTTIEFFSFCKVVKTLKPKQTLFNNSTFGIFFFIYCRVRICSQNK